MGNLLFKAVSKKGTDMMTSTSGSLKEFSAINIDGVNTELAELMSGKKCTLVVNVATK